MLLNSISLPNYRNVCFRANVQSNANIAPLLNKDTFEISKGTKRKQVILPEYFFIKMFGYGKNIKRANEMVDLTYKASEMIQNKDDFDEILDFIADEINKINYSNNKRYGQKRLYGPKEFRLEKQERGEEYFDIYDKKLRQYFKKNKNKKTYFPNKNEEYSKANVCSIIKEKYIGDDAFLISFVIPKEERCSNVDLAKKEYKKLISKKAPKVEDIVRTSAIINWLLAQETPYYHGSDSIANVLTKAIFHSYNIKLSPVKKGKSLDFEAFYRDLDDYIKAYPTFFEQKPSKV